jgi:GDP-L-fucose synthase
MTPLGEDFSFPSFSVSSVKSVVIPSFSLLCTSSGLCGSIFLRFGSGFAAPSVCVILTKLVSIAAARLQWRMEIERDARIYVAGHTGLVGSAIWRELSSRGFTQLLGRTRRELDLLDTNAVRDFYAKEKPEYVFVAAAKVGGILANDQRPAEFLFENLQIQSNLIDSAYRAGVKKLLFLGSSCIYPKLAPQPLKEDYLLTGPLEPTNEWYAIAKIAGIKLCQAYRKQHGCNFISAMPTNLYGPNDNYDLQSSHVLPALIRKFQEAKLTDASSVTCWGTGSPMREFLHADDLARACLFLLENYEQEQFINIGYGSDLSIAELAGLIKRVVGFKGETLWDKSRPDGTPRKLLDTSRLFDLGWKPQIDLEAGIRLAYEDFLAKPGHEK